MLLLISAIFIYSLGEFEFIIGAVFDPDNKINPSHHVELLEISNSIAIIELNTKANAELYLERINIDGAWCFSEKTKLEIGLNTFDISSCSINSSLEVSTSILQINGQSIIKNFN